MYSEIHNLCKSLYRVELFISVQIISSAFLFTRFTQLCQMRLKKMKYSTHQSSKHSHGFAGFFLYNLNTLPPSPPLLPPPPRSTPPISYCFLFHLLPHPRFNNLIFLFSGQKKTHRIYPDLPKSHLRHMHPHNWGAEWTETIGYAKALAS